MNFRNEHWFISLVILATCGNGGQQQASGGGLIELGYERTRVDTNLMQLFIPLWQVVNEHC